MCTAFRCTGVDSYFRNISGYSCPECGSQFIPRVIGKIIRNLVRKDGLFGGEEYDVPQIVYLRLYIGHIRALAVVVIVTVSVGDHQILIGHSYISNCRLCIQLVACCIGYRYDIVFVCSNMANTGQGEGLPTLYTRFDNPVIWSCNYFKGFGVPDGYLMHTVLTGGGVYTHFGNHAVHLRIKLGAQHKMSAAAKALIRILRCKNGLLCLVIGQGRVVNDAVARIVGTLHDADLVVGCTGRNKGKRYIGSLGIGKFPGGNNLTGSIPYK